MSNPYLFSAETHTENPRRGALQRQRLPYSTLFSRFAIIFPIVFVIVTNYSIRRWIGGVQVGFPGFLRVAWLSGSGVVASHFNAITFSVAASAVLPLSLGLGYLLRAVVTPEAWRVFILSFVSCVLLGFSKFQLHHHEVTWLSALEEFPHAIGGLLFNISVCSACMSWNSVRLAVVLPFFILSGFSVYVSIGNWALGYVPNEHSVATIAAITSDAFVYSVLSIVGIFLLRHYGALRSSRDSRAGVTVHGSR